MPQWPGWVLAAGGALIGIAALVVVEGVRQGAMAGDPRLLGWLALAGGVAFVAGLVYIAVRQLRVRRHLPPERYRGPAVLLLLVLGFVAAAIPTIPFAADAAALLGGDGELSLVGAIVLLVSTQLALLAVSWLFVFRPRALIGWPSWAGRDPLGALRSGLGWGVLAWFGATIIQLALIWLLDRFGISVPPEPAEQALAVVDPWLVVLAIVILAPLAEELFFRGVVFNAWLREGGMRYALIGSALLFAVIHLSPVTFLPIFGLGLALAWVYRRAGNLLAPIAMHATVNGISVGLALLIRFSGSPLPS